MSSLKLTIPCSRPSAPPVWSKLVERWSQLDDTCYTFCEALHQWDYFNGLAAPDFIFLVLENASNSSDYEFIRGEIPSPAKFVYTLPNIGGAIICQLLKIKGRVFCISSGSQSLNFAISEAKFFNGSGKSVWIISNSTESDNARAIEFLNFGSKI